MRNLYNKKRETFQENANKTTVKNDEKRLW